LSLIRVDHPTDKHCCLLFGEVGLAVVLLIRRDRCAPERERIDLVRKCLDNASINDFVCGRFKWWKEIPAKQVSAGRPVGRQGMRPDL
jgi:hypothetical protein